MASEEVRARVSEGVRRKWQEPEYRAKYSEEHFSAHGPCDVGRPCSTGEASRKIARQWEDGVFAEPT